MTDKQPIVAYYIEKQGNHSLLHKVTIPTITRAITDEVVERNTSELVMEQASELMFVDAKQRRA